jgi:hypothetical protein
MGAILSSRLAKSILTVLTVDQVIYWTDSENAYYWVRNQSREFKPFVSNWNGKFSAQQVLNNGTMSQEP